MPVEVQAMRFITPFKVAWVLPLFLAMGWPVWPQPLSSDFSTTPTLSPTPDPSASAPVSTKPVFQLPEVLVIGKSLNLVGTADTASEGFVGQDDLANRPLLRPGEVMENVPGMIVTQHSGDGKANQYFLRGFNLDHGTDFATWIDGMPANLPTQAHGQGYMDLNFMIPELVESVNYQKGPYYAEDGDFSSAGAAQIRIFRTLPHGLAEVTSGYFGYQRALAADSSAIGSDTLVYALETEHMDGPWDVPENFKKYNGLLRYGSGSDQKGWDLTAMGYEGDWYATNQIPERAVEEGLIDRFGSFSPTDGGKSYRWSLSGEWRDNSPSAGTTVQAYDIRSYLDLFSNFSLYYNNPVQGDQFEQYDDRDILGGQVIQTWNHDLLGAGSRTTAGLQIRNDFLHIGLYNTANRVRFSTDSDDQVNLLSGGIYVSNLTHWNDWFRTTIGLRGDAVRYDVTANVPGNSGTSRGALLSPKADLVLGPWGGTEFYLSGGFDYHSNDARGTVKNWDVTTQNGGPVTTANPNPDYPALVQSRGAEFGVRCESIPNLRSTVSFWLLDLDSELVFDGDDGTTDPSGATRRIGIEWANDWRPLDWIILDADLSTSQAHYFDTATYGLQVPEAVADVVSAGVCVKAPQDFKFEIRLRYFGPRFLGSDETGDHYSQDTALVNAGAEYTRGDATLALEVFNLFNTQADDITYYDVSQLKGESAPQYDFMFHPVEPLGLRASLKLRI